MNTGNMFSLSGILPREFPENSVYTAMFHKEHAVTYHYKETLELPTDGRDINLGLAK